MLANKRDASYKIRADRPLQSFKRIFKYISHSKLKLTFVIFVAFLNVFTNLTGTYMIRYVIDFIITPIIENTLPQITLVYVICIMVSCYIVSFILYAFQVRMMISIAQDGLRKLRKELFDKLVHLPLSFFDNVTHGDIMSRFTNDVNLINELFTTSFLELLTSITLIVGISIYIFILNYIMALVAIMFIPCVILIIKVFAKRAKKGFRGVQKNLGELEGYSEEIISGQRVVKAFNKEEDCIKEFDDLMDTLSKNSFVSNFNSTLTMPIVNNLSSINHILCCLVGALLVFYKVELPHLVITGGVIGSFIAFLKQFTRPVNRISQQLNSVQSALAGADRVFQILDLDNEDVSDNPKYHLQNIEGVNYWVFNIPASEDELESLSKEEISSNYYQSTSDLDSSSSSSISYFKKIKVEGDIRFNNVSFSYKKDQVILKDLNLYAKPGQKIAFVGSTGAGKTTITNLLTRFYEIDGGEILVDGISIHEIDRYSMRKTITLVLQDTHLFTGTILDNIRFGNLTATREDCIKACQVSYASNFIEKLEAGYDTLIYGTNDTLSQGQRQLLSIARCAVNNPPILILDEATSSVDTRTEKLISHGMDVLMKDRTSLVIAHRLSTVRNANAIMVLSHGEIVERGDHDDLLNQKGTYYSLFTGKSKLE